MSVFNLKFISLIFGDSGLRINFERQPEIRILTGVVFGSGVSYTESL